jgi:beta-alanine--pyruvate transaminase
VFARVAELAPYFLDNLYSALQNIDIVTDIRGYGLLAGFDLAPDGTPGRRGMAATQRLFETGLHIKFTGDAGLVAPPLIAEKKHIDEICEKLQDVISSL